LDGYGIGFLKVTFGYISEAGFARRFFHITTETGVGCLYDDWFAECIEDFRDFLMVKFVLIQEGCGNVRNVEFFEQCVLVDFVGADLDGFWVFYVS